MSCHNNAPNPISDVYNLDFESIDTSGFPRDWHSQSSITDGYAIEVDSIIKKKYCYSISIENRNSNTSFGSLSRELPVPIHGGNFKLTGYIKCDKVNSGFAGIWVKVLDKFDRIVFFDNMVSQKIKGTSEWKKYSIETWLDSSLSDKIIIGALLVGNGKAWIDNLEVTIDDLPIEKIASRKILKSNGNFNDSVIRVSDSYFNRHKNKITGTQIKQIAEFAKLWAFMKYHFPVIKSGKLNWDSVLFVSIPKVLENSERLNIIYEEKLLKILLSHSKSENQIDTFLNNKEKLSDLYKRFPDKRLGPSIINEILLRCKNDQNTNQYYIELTPYIGNPIIKNEYLYGGTGCPTTTLRLLGLIRYWSIIQYFYPYKYLINENWNDILIHFIPKFINALNKQHYILTCLELVGRIQDSHAFISNPTLDSIKGLNILPINVKYINDEIVVTGFYDRKILPNNIVDIGCRLKKINGVPVKELIKKYLPITPGSNLNVRMRDLCSLNGFLLRTNSAQVHLTFVKDETPQNLIVKTIPIKFANTLANQSDIDIYPPYKLIGNVTYVNAGKLSIYSLDSIKQMSEFSKGLIIDLRCYPSTFMPYTFGEWLKESSSPFACFTKVSLNEPGIFKFTPPVNNGGIIPNNNGFNFSIVTKKTFKGQVVIIVNELTQSQAEFTAMALGSVPGAKIIGSRTAGADGDISFISFPGSVKSGFSGIGVYYPNFVQTQKTGVLIDVPISPTLKAIKIGRDEYLEAALKLIKK